MKGKLSKTKEGWFMKHGQPVNLKILDVVYVHNNYNEKLPLHPSDIKTYDWLYQAYTPEEFENISDDTLYLFTKVEENNITYAKIIKEELNNESSKIQRGTA